MYRITRLLTTTLAVSLLLTAPGAAQFREWSAEALSQPIDGATVDLMAQAGDLVVVSRYADSLLSDRTHEYLAQYVDGVPVHGAGVSRQTRNGETVSLFGRIHEGIDVGTVPALSSDAALTGLALATGAFSVDTPALVILPLPDASYRLTYRALMSDARLYFVDAADGSIVWSHDVTREQRAVGVGTGIAGDRKSVSTTRAEGLYQTIDQLRPAEIVTLDMRLDESRLQSLIVPGPPGVPRWSAGDLAADTNNVWNDNPAAVDGHVHTGWTYDYFALRHDWHGVDGKNGRIVSLVNNDFFNALYRPPPFGPEGRGVFVYGQKPDGTSLAAEDIVAHELMHGVTDALVGQRTGHPFPLSFIYGVLGPPSFEDGDGRVLTCDNFEVPFSHPRFPEVTALRPYCDEGRFVLWTGDGGIIHEAYSDIFAHAVEFFHEDRAGALAGDYLAGEDIDDVIRASDNPGSISLGTTGIPYPDALRGMLRFILATPDGRTITAPSAFTGLAFIEGRFVAHFRNGDDGGVHINSTVLSHAFYLAIEGGRNATTGRSVTGVGPDNRADVERAFFRAMADLMPPDASLYDAALAIQQSAFDLFGAGSPTFTAITEALLAVGFEQ